MKYIEKIKTIVIFLSILFFGILSSSVFAEEIIVRQKNQSFLQCIPSVISPDGDQVNDYTTISIFLESKECVTLIIEDFEGKVVLKILEMQWLASGRHQYIWGGKDHEGKLVPEGKYYVKLIFPYQNSLTYIKEIKIKPQQNFKVNINKTFYYRYVWVNGNEQSFQERNRGLKPGSSHDQSLQVELEGTFLNHFYIYGSFDDQLSDIQVKKDFTFGYKSKWVDLYLGNYTLKPFKNHLFSYSQKLWGVRGEKKGHYTLFYGQTEGIQVTEKFAGKGVAESYLLGHKNIVFESEKIYLDDTLLIRDQDYQIDYYTGEIIFTEIISSTSQIKVTYEYYPGIGEQITPRRFLLTEYHDKFNSFGLDSYIIFWHDVEVETKVQTEKKPTFQKQVMFLNKINYEPIKNLEIEQEIGFHFHDTGESELIRGVATQTNFSYQTAKRQAELDLKWESNQFYFVEKSSDEGSEKEINIRYRELLPMGIKLETGANHKFVKEEWQNFYRLKGALKREPGLKYDIELTFRTSNDELTMNHHLAHQFSKFYVDIKTKNQWFYKEHQMQYDSFSLTNRFRYIPFKKLDLTLTIHNYQSQKEKSEERYALKWIYKPLQDLTLDGEGQWMESYIQNHRKQYLGTMNIQYKFPLDINSQLKLKGKHQEEKDKLSSNIIVSQELETILRLEKKPYGVQIGYMYSLDKMQNESKKVRGSLTLPEYRGVSLTPSIEYSMPEQKLSLMCYSSYLFLDRYQAVFNYSRSWNKEIYEDIVTVGVDFKFEKYFQINLNHDLFHLSNKANPEENYWGGVLKIGASAVF
ncbi:hypothetical protein BBF96_14205 [Anoxybacter fermentans]|uniref:FlgD/Vpr Ig-like domain-containing protein n=1 Tax=Anoxybacter fermentans TaxID=1323375 RepID=A0A3Q9HSB2_9FIRM|nr:FlgD immunoglobulin-like domain containing protein [Anoxybacter fermentans]AZR74437.1 hypothetical protein BBF96_14205 [Anoxybacter fermentans]